MTNLIVVALVLVVFFVISFLTNILGPLIPDIIHSFELSVGLAGFLPFAFFVAYGVMSIPSGILVEKYSEKPVIISAFLLSAIGAFVFAINPSFLVAMLSLFSIGVGMAMLQVAINPLLRTAGGEENFAFNSVLAQLFFGLASFLSPQVYSYLVVPSESSSSLRDVLLNLVPANLQWVSLYWVFAVISMLMVVIVATVKLPKVIKSDEEKVEGLEVYIELFKNRTVLFFFFGIMCYVGAEQGIANWISQFLFIYHDVDPKTVGADTISNFWGALTLGCILGLATLKLIDSKLALMGFSVAAVICLLTALFGSKEVSLIAFPMVGFFLSVMWSVIFSLALNSLSDHHGAFSGILCTGIVGGAFFPLIVGNIAQVSSLQYGMMFMLLPLVYIFIIGLKAQPIIKNKTIFSQTEASVS
ncbi:MFS transporter [Thalassotalea sp. SU-HH00458]|uniref:MFS transporter n=1 Tax=Thalassotalea sp. SU-HH00458 TaxID=3127657 RepID=UPI0033655BBD